MRETGETVRVKTAKMRSEKECQLIEHFNWGRAAQSCPKTIYLWFILLSDGNSSIIKKQTNKQKERNRKTTKNKLTSKLDISKLVNFVFVKVDSLSHERRIQLEKIP